MEFLLFLIILGIAILTAWIYSTIDQTDDLDDHMRN